MMCEAQYGTRTIQFDLERRAVKHLTIRVQPSGAVEVIAPAHSAEASVIGRVARRGRWILRQQRMFEAVLPAPSERRVSGQSIRYLGRQYRLRIRSGSPAGIRMSRGVVEIVVKDKQPDKTGATPPLERWLRGRAQQKLAERFQRCTEAVHRFGITPKGFGLRRMPRRWGSCGADRRILLNPALICAPVDCIDYVIIHELCHLRHHDHGPRFYELLTRLLPDWKLRKARLERQTT